MPVLRLAFGDALAPAATVTEALVADAEPPVFVAVTWQASW